VEGGRCVTEGKGVYGDNEACVIKTLRALAVTATEFQTESGYDHLTIAGTLYHGDYGPQALPLYQGAELVWTSDGSITFDGFTVCASETGACAIASPTLFCQRKLPMSYLTRFRAANPMASPIANPMANPIANPMANPIANPTPNKWPTQFIFLFQTRQFRNSHAKYLMSDAAPVTTTSATARTGTSLICRAVHAVDSA